MAICSTSFRLKLMKGIIRGIALSCKENARYRNLHPAFLNRFLLHTTQPGGSIPTQILSEMRMPVFFVMRTRVQVPFMVHTTAGEQI